MVDKEHVQKSVLKTWSEKATCNM